LEQSHHFSLLELAEFARLPFAANSLGNLLGGAIPLRLVARGWSPNRARKLTMTAASAVAAGFGIALAVVRLPWLAVLCVSGLSFGHGLWGNVALPAEVLPQRAVATVSGLGGTLGGLAGIATQLGIGLALEKLPFGWLFAGCGILYFLALILTQKLAGEIGKIAEIPEEKTRVQFKRISTS
jgi:ACS family hexuronate transporter-like MFS transporter